MAAFSIDLILDILLVLIFGIATSQAFRLSKKLYGGRFTTALPYLAISLAILFIMPLILLIVGWYLPIKNSVEYWAGLLAVQIVAGIFLLNALYQIYESKFATEGFGFK